MIEPITEKQSYTLKQLVLCFLKPGYSGFGSPVAVVCALTGAVVVIAIIHSLKIIQ